MAQEKEKQPNGKPGTAAIMHEKGADMGRSDLFLYKTSGGDFITGQEEIDQYILGCKRWSIHSTQLLYSFTFPVFIYLTYAHFSLATATMPRPSPAAKQVTATALGHSAADTHIVQCSD
jgi:hypothetical protein